MARKCGVCVDSESKYKCPVCLIPYCSLPCYRTHKETPCSKPVTSLEVGAENAPGQPPRSFEEDEEESGWRLRRSQLEALAASEEIRQMLRDDELRNLIQKVDSSVTPEKDLDKAMEGSAFREFTDKVLAMINLDEHSHLTQS